MLRENNNMAETRRSRVGVWLALLSVACLQLSTAVHQFEHVAEYIELSCDVCIQLDRVSDAVVDHAATAESLPTITTRAWQAPAGAVVLTTIRGFDSRAPPCA